MWPNTDWSVAAYLWTGQIQLSGIWSKCKPQFNQIKHGHGAFEITLKPTWDRGKNLRW